MDPRALRTALGYFATGVTVITALGEDGRRVGITANSFSSVSMEPPLVLWCPNVASPSARAFVTGRPFVVNVLAESQRGISDRFARRSDDKFRGVATGQGLGGVPVIGGSAAVFECVVVDRHLAGDHWIVVGEVKRFAIGEGRRPLVFHGGEYRGIGNELPLRGEPAAHAAQMSARMSATDDARPPASDHQFPEGALAGGA